MNRLIDKALLLFICFISLFSADSFTEPVVAVFVTVSVSAAVQLLTGRRTAAVIIAAFSLLCGVYPLFFCMMPVLLYDALWEKKWWLTLPSAIVLTHTEIISPRLLITLIGFAAAVIIYMRISRLESTVARLASLRDETAGRNQQLYENNIRLAEAQDNEIQLATMKERNRIAREIHDNVGHMLTRSLLQSGALMIINKDEKLRGPLEELRSTLDSAMTSIRESVHDLHDDSIDLKKVIEECMATVDKRFGVTLDCDECRDMAGNIKLCIIGVVKEGLSNAVKHSKGDRIRIAVREHPAFYQLMLEDNGSCSQIKESGIGLSNMRDRAAALGGRITFTPSAEGFRIFMSIPKQ
jgi:signal transduction histidine kinase